MEDKNRFSILLEHLLEVAEVKNYTLAKRLQYDVSYISKWVSGRMLPAKKTEKRVMEGISACVVDEATDDGRDLLLREYSVSIPSDLKAAIYDNLIAEYDYLQEELDSGEARIGPYTDFWAELNMLQYLTKMAHPVLRRVSQLDIVAVMDLMEMAREYRLKVANLQNGQLVDQRSYDNVYFKLMIDISREKWDPIYDAALIINVLTNFNHIHFKLFGSTAAAGRAVFVVKGDFAITGLLVSHSRCAAVTATEDPQNCESLYDNFSKLCVRDDQLFRDTSMRQLISQYGYMHTLLASNLRWMFGHLNELLLPDDLFEEILTAHEAELKDFLGATPAELRSVHNLAKGVVEETNIRILIYEAAFSSMAVSGELDFFSYKVSLTQDQRSRCISYVLQLCKQREKLEFRLISGRIVNDFQYVADPNMFLSGAASYLRLDNNCPVNQIAMVNNSVMEDRLSEYFDQVWNLDDQNVTKERNAIAEHIHHVLQGIHLITRAKSDEMEELQESWMNKI